MKWTPVGGGFKICNVSGIIWELYTLSDWYFRNMIWHLSTLDQNVATKHYIRWIESCFEYCITGSLFLASTAVLTVSIDVVVLLFIGPLRPCQDSLWQNGGFVNPLCTMYTKMYTTTVKSRICFDCVSEIKLSAWKKLTVDERLQMFVQSYDSHVVLVLGCP